MASRKRKTIGFWTEEELADAVNEIVNDSDSDTENTYLLNYSMVQSPSWEANWFADSQEIPRISRNPKVHYRTHQRSPPVSILG